jgi:phosphatidylinositol glycan class O
MRFLNVWLFWVSSAFVFGVGVWLFASGFLLTRLELESVSVCHHSVGCTPPRFQKVLLIIIDALRYDFTVSNPTVQGPYLNKLSILSQKNGFLARARADPPTTTLQRLKAITTGNLPTFVDAGSNFNSDAINEDNLLLQYLNANKSSKSGF